MRYRALHALPFPSIQNSFAFAYAPLVSPPNSDSFPRNQFSCAEVFICVAIFSLPKICV
jgi:hypothetical protein